MPDQQEISIAKIEHWEHICPQCGAETQRHSIDGGMSSTFYGECGHVWVCDPFARKGKEPKDSYDYRSNLPIERFYYKRTRTIIT